MERETGLTGGLQGVEMSGSEPPPIQQRTLLGNDPALALEPAATIAGQGVMMATTPAVLHSTAQQVQGWGETDLQRPGTPQ